MPEADNRPTETTWPAARAIAYATGHVGEPVTVSLGEAGGAVLATALTALTDLPAFDTVTMDGWAVAGTGPWRLVQQILAGDQGEPLLPGQAASVATGAQSPEGTTAVLRSEHGRSDADWVSVTEPAPELPAGRDLRRRGEEARRGDVLLPAGSVVSPPVLGLAAAAGHDALSVYRPPRIDVFIMGDELLDMGMSDAGLLRDSLTPQVPGWISSAGGRPGVVSRVADNRSAAITAIASSDADIVMTTGGTAHGLVDQLHPALDHLSATMLIDSVAVRPGHPMVLAQLPTGQPLLGLPGNPLAAAVTYVSIGLPLIASCRGLPMPELRRAKLRGSIIAPPEAHRLMPVRVDESGSETVVEPLLHHGPAMLTGLAQADALAVAPPGGAVDGQSVDVLPLPWAAT
jgi:molybdopterin molybdotransferase